MRAPVVLILGAASVAGGCGDSLTQVVVHFDVPPPLSARTDAMDLVVEWGGLLSYDRRFDVAVDGLPTQLPVVPGSAPGNSRFRLTGTLYHQTDQISETRAEIGFVRGAQRDVWLRFEEGCSCSRVPWETCSAGSCVPACVEATAGGGPGRPTPLEACGCDQTVLQVAPGREAACALWGGAQGCRQLWCWGASPVGGGSGEPEMRLVEADPVELRCSAAGKFCCFIDAAGEVGCFGEDGDRQLGGGGARVPLVQGATALALGSGHACALGQSDGGPEGEAAVWCWGRNNSDQVGVGLADPAPVTRIPLEGVSAIAAGSEHTCAVVSGLVRCWGRGDSGELGAVPGEPVGTEGGVLDGVVAIDAGGDSQRGFSCALRDTGDVMCWGNNKDSQLGSNAADRCADEGTVCGLVAAQVAGLPSASGISLGLAHACARTHDGAVWCWGSGEAEALGVTDQTNRATPVDTGIRGATTLALGSQISCAIQNGVAGCWGRNQRELGTLGAGTTGPEQQSVFTTLACPSTSSCP